MSALKTNPTRDNAGRQPGEVGETSSTFSGNYTAIGNSVPAHSPVVQRRLAGVVTQHNDPAVEYPGLYTQPARLLAAFLGGRKINPLDGWQSLGIYRLSDTVYQLRKLGWPVITDNLDVDNRFGEPCRVALYSLPDDSIEAAGEQGRKYAADRAMLDHERRVA